MIDQNLRRRVHLLLDELEGVELFSTFRQKLRNEGHTDDQIHSVLATMMNDGEVLFRKSEDLTEFKPQLYTGYATENFNIYMVTIHRAKHGKFHIGFTGTRHISRVHPDRLTSLKTLLDNYAFHHRDAVVILHHGDCQGADAMAHHIARQCNMLVTIHPPVDPKWRAFCNGDEILEPKPFLERNHDIVNSCNVLVALPRQKGKEIQRSGTWSTIRYARLSNPSLPIVEV